MKTLVGCLMLRNLPAVPRASLLAVALAVVTSGAAAQADTAQMQEANARRTELRTLVSQPHQSTPASGKAAETRHLSAEERSELRRQLGRDLRAQSATVADASRP